MDKKLAEHNECFISHCTDDQKIMKRFTAILKKWYPDYLVFNSFDKGSLAGKKISDELRDHLARASFMIAFITDSYLRSTYCISEICSFWYQNKTVIPIVFNHETGIKVVNSLLTDVDYIDTSNPPAKCAMEFIDAMEGCGFKLNDSLEAAKKDLSDFFRTAKQVPTARPWIGCGETEDRIIRFCAGFGIREMAQSGKRVEEIGSYLMDTREMFIIATTGANLISGLSSGFLPEYLSRGSDVTVLTPNLYSDFCNDVARIESPDDADSRKRRLADAFSSVVTDISGAFARAERIKPRMTGEVYFGCASTLIRQTIVCGLKNREIRGWVSLTLPPSRTNDGTVSFLFSGRIDQPGTFAHGVYEHVIGIKAIARQRGQWFSLRELRKRNGQDNLKKFGFMLENDAALDYWKNKLNTARQTMRGRYDPNKTADRSGCHLIEVSAKHPLENGMDPDKEFRSRLDAAAALYRRLKESGKSVTVYVPGSLHTPDKCSLSAAGKRYLESAGIPADDIVGEKENRDIKGSDGVYNSADECFVATQLFLRGKYEMLHCVCSPNQLARKQLFYLEFGVLPLFHAVPCEEMAHDPVDEILLMLPDIIKRDHSWQGADSRNGQRTRDQRMPERQAAGAARVSPEEEN